MSNDKIINLETYEVIDDDSKFIIVDSLIADTIVILNQLGYKTKACCSGHSFPQKKELFINQDLDYLEDVEKENIHDIVEIREESFDYWYEWTFTDIYILFNKIYDFLNLPEGFCVDDDNNCCIRCTVEFYKDGKRKKIDDIHKEIEKYNNTLYEWARKLPKIN